MTTLVIIVRDVVSNNGDNVDQHSYDDHDYIAKK